MSMKGMTMSDNIHKITVYSDTKDLNILMSVLDRLFPDKQFKPTEDPWYGTTTFYLTLEEVNLVKLCVGDEDYEWGIKEV